MPNRDRIPKEPRNDAAFWVIAGLMALIMVGGLAYGLSYPTLQASNPSPSQTTGSGSRTSHPM